jgi:hypothetical protein
MLPILFVPQMLFAGFFVAPDLIPFGSDGRVTFARCSVRIMVVAEFDRDCGSVEGNKIANSCWTTLTPLFRTKLGGIG